MWPIDLAARVLDLNIYSMLLEKCKKKALGKVRRLTAGQSHIFCDLFLQLLPVTFYPLKKKNTEPLLIEARAKPDIKYAKGISALSWAANK